MVQRIGHPNTPRMMFFHGVKLALLDNLKKFHKIVVTEIKSIHLHDSIERLSQKIVSSTLHLISTIQSQKLRNDNHECLLKMFVEGCQKNKSYQAGCLTIK